MNDLPTSPRRDIDFFSRDQIVEHQSSRFRALLQAIEGKNKFWTERLTSAGLTAANFSSLSQLSQLPLLPKVDIVADYSQNSPYGSNLTFDPKLYSRMHQTSGTTGAPMRWLDTPDSWNWLMTCWDQIFRMANVTSDDRFMFPFSFGPFLGFWGAFDAASRHNYLVLPGGGLSSSARLKMIVDNNATVVCCTPTYALRLAEVAEQENISLTESSVRMLIVAGEPGGSLPAVRQRMETSWGARVIDHWGMTEIGALASECLENPGGIHVLETECIAEIVDPASGEPVAAGELGELVLTNLGRAGSPLIRYRTGDLVMADQTACPCGRSLLRLAGGIQGRVDDMITIRGNNFFPSSIEAILRKLPDVVEFQIEVSKQRSMHHVKLTVEPKPTAEVEPLLARIRTDIKDQLNFQPEVVAVPESSLPRFELKGRRLIRHDLE